MILMGLVILKCGSNALIYNTGSALTNCALRSILRGKVSITWDSKGGKSGELSTDADALLSVNQALSFDGGNGYLKSFRSRDSKCNWQFYHRHVG